MKAEDVTLKIEGILFDNLLHPKERRKRAIKVMEEYASKKVEEELVEFVVSISLGMAKDPEAHKAWIQKKAKEYLKQKEQ